MKTETKIEIIDDEEDLCFLLKRGLSKKFNHIEYSHTLKEGLPLFEKLNPNWLILDNNLPDGLGWQQTNSFLQINPEINIIYISANPDSIIDKSLKNAYHFIKPLDIVKITDLILSKQEQTCSCKA
ncbi:MAG: response regulator [Bacteroidia bacterium]